MSALRQHVVVLGGQRYQQIQHQQQHTEAMKPSAVASLLSTVARNRKELFDLVAAIEQAGHCEIDVEAMQAVIDDEFDGRLELTETEAQYVLLMVAKPKPG